MTPTNADRTVPALGSCRVKPVHLETMYLREQNEVSGGEFEWTRDKNPIRVANRFRIVARIGEDLVE